MNAGPAGLDQLRASLQSAFNLPSKFALQFVDDEGDTCVISTPTELTEALALASAQKLSALKVFICTDGDHSDAEMVSVSDVTEEVAKEEKEAKAAAPALVATETLLVAPVDVSPAPAARAPSESAEPAAATPAAASWHELVVSFASDPQINAALPVSIAAAFASVKEGDQAQTVVDTFLAR